MAKENVLYPNNIIYGDCRVEDGFKDLISHLTEQTLEFLYEQKLAQKSSL
jgi:hypothetical protein